MSLNTGNAKNIAIQNLKCLCVQLLIEVLCVLKSLGSSEVIDYEVCKIIHSILVEDPAIIYQIHEQTYPSAIMEHLVDNVESLHVILNQFLCSTLQLEFQQLLELMTKTAKKKGERDELLLVLYNI